MITRQSTLSLIPHNNQVTNEEISIVSKDMKKDNLIVTSGQILKTGEDLVAVSHSTTPGMAVSPIIVSKDIQWKVCGKILGGPAVPGL